MLKISKIAFCIAYLLLSQVCLDAAPDSAKHGVSNVVNERSNEKDKNSVLSKNEDEKSKGKEISPKKAKQSEESVYKNESSESNSIPYFDDIADAIEEGDLEYVRRAIESGFDVNSRDENKLTLLLIAINCRVVEAVKLLLNAGADPNAVDGRFKISPLLKAIRSGNLDMVLLLVQHGAIPGSDVVIEELVQLVEQRGELFGLWEMVEEAAEKYYAQKVSASGRNKIYRTMSQSTLDLNWKEMKKAIDYEVEHAKAYEQYSKVLKKILEYMRKLGVNPLRNVSTLSSKKFDELNEVLAQDISKNDKTDTFASKKDNLSDSKKKTEAFFKSVLKMNVEEVESLLKEGVDVNVKGPDFGETPMDIIVSKLTQFSSPTGERYEKAKQVFKILCFWGANFSEKNIVDLVFSGNIEIIKIIAMCNGGWAGNGGIINKNTVKNIEKEAKVRMKRGESPNQRCRDCLNFLRVFVGMPELDSSGTESSQNSERNGANTNENGAEGPEKSENEDKKRAKNGKVKNKINSANEKNRDTNKVSVLSDGNDETDIEQIVEQTSKGLSEAKVYTIKTGETKFVSEEGNTPLHEAVKNGNLKLVKIIIENDQSQLNALNDAGETPLHTAIKMENSAIIKLLLGQSQIDVSAHGITTSSALDYAIENQDIATVRMLVERGAPVWVANLTHAINLCNFEVFSLLFDNFAGDNAGMQQIYRAIIAIKKLDRDFYKKSLEKVKGEAKKKKIKLSKK